MQKKEIKKKSGIEINKNSNESINPIAIEELLFMLLVIKDVISQILQDKKFSHEKTFQKIRDYVEKYYADNRLYYSKNKFIFHEDIIINKNVADICIDKLDELQYEDVYKQLEVHEIVENGFLSIPRLIYLLSEKSFWDGLYNEAKKQGPDFANYNDFLQIKKELQNYSNEIGIQLYIPINVKRWCRFALDTASKMINSNEMTVKAKSLFLYKPLTEAGIENKNQTSIASFIAMLIGGDKDTIYGYFKHIKKSPMNRKKGEYISGSVNEIMEACQSLLKVEQGTESVFKKVYTDLVAMKEEECNKLKQYADKEHNTQTLSYNPQDIAE